MYAFRYRRPSSVEEALELADGDEEAKYLAGGMTLIPALKHRLAAPSQLIDVARLAGLRHCERIGNTAQGLWRIGAAVKHVEVAQHAALAQDLPALATLAAGIGDPQVRARGTIGGSVANNDPAADYPSALLALQAVVITNRRRLEAHDFFQGMFTTALEDQEMILAVEFPVPKRAAYAKFPHPATGYAMAGVFVAEHQGGDWRVAVTGVGAGVFRWVAAEEAIAAGDPAPALERDDLMEDMHAPGAYRAHLASVMLAKARVQLANGV
jgi:carbon-monoxide dehydrogenase medium subunit